MSLKKSLKYNTFAIAYSNYLRAVQEVDSRELQLVSSGYISIVFEDDKNYAAKINSKEVSDEEMNYFNSFTRAMSGSVIDTISVLAYLRLSKQIPKDTYHLVDNLLKEFIDSKRKDDLFKDVIKSNMKKSKNGAINVLWKKIKKKENKK